MSKNSIVYSLELSDKINIALQDKNTLEKTSIRQQLSRNIHRSQSQPQPQLQSQSLKKMSKSTFMKKKALELVQIFKKKKSPIKDNKKKKGSSNISQATDHGYCSMPTPIMNISMGCDSTDLPLIGWLHNHIINIYIYIYIHIYIYILTPILIDII